MSYGLMHKFRCKCTSFGKLVLQLFQLIDRFLPGSWGEAHIAGFN
jgi:hypothetical protein